MLLEKKDIKPRDKLVLMHYKVILCSLTADIISHCKYLNKISFFVTLKCNDDLLKKKGNVSLLQRKVSYRLPFLN